ncbi:uncharacterized protein [Rutidosis leptorrhynchoides]|uniref:uncharacterized protein n=1 Tax=Rutidosis leptorrhynchoides TaxID=125765 RepID=UPI003A9A4AFF
MSPIWRSLINLHEDDSLSNVIGANCWRCKLGDDSQISFWNDFWAGNFSLRERYPNLFRWCLAQDQKVCFFRFPVSIQVPQSSWNLHLISPLTELDFLNAEELLFDLQDFYLKSSPNVVVWSPSYNGEYSVADAVRLLTVSGQACNIEWKKLIWNNRVSSKISIFHWLACKRSIPVRDILIRRHILPLNHPPMCTWCETEVETVDHLLLHYPWTFKVWSELFQWWNIRWVIPSSILEFSANWYNGMGIGDKKFWRLIGPATIWAIWLARNDFVFNGNYTCWASIVRKIKLKVFVWATTFKLCFGHQSFVWNSNPRLLCFSM